MEITAREAARRLGTTHRLSRDLARRILAAGLAGPGRRTAGALMFEEGLVQELLDRPMCWHRILDHWRPLIVRLGRNRAFDLTDDWARQADVVGPGWHVTDDVRWAIKDRPRNRLPLVATLGGFVVFGADIVALRGDEGPYTPTRSRPTPTCSFELELPATWWGDIAGTWLPINNGPTWTLWGAPTTTRTIDYLRADVAEQLRVRAAEELTFSTWALRGAAARAARPPDRR